MSTGVFNDAWRRSNPAWVQLLGLCPLMAVSNSVVNAVGLALATTGVLVGSNVSVAALKRWIPHYARLPCFVLLIATFTTTAMLIMMAFTFELYLAIALFVQIIVTNCMILGRAEAFARTQPVGQALVDALGTALGFALALVILGAVREFLATGCLFAGMDLLFGRHAASWQVGPITELPPVLLAALPPGAFITAGLLLALANASRRMPLPEHQQGLDGQS